MRGKRSAGRDASLSLAASSAAATFSPSQHLFSSPYYPLSVSTCNLLRLISVWAFLTNLIRLQTPVDVDSIHIATLPPSLVNIDTIAGIFKEPTFGPPQMGGGGEEEFGASGGSLEGEMEERGGGGTKVHSTAMSSDTSMFNSDQRQTGSSGAAKALQVFLDPPPPPEIRWQLVTIGRKSFTASYHDRKLDSLFEPFQVLYDQLAVSVGWIVCNHHLPEKCLILYAESLADSMREPCWTHQSWHACVCQCDSYAPRRAWLGPEVMQCVLTWGEESGRHTLTHTHIHTHKHTRHTHSPCCAPSRPVPRACDGQNKNPLFRLHHERRRKEWEQSTGEGWFILTHPNRRREQNNNKKIAF